MKILVLERDLFGLWNLKGVYTVVAETESAYEVKVFKMFRKWVLKNSAWMRCEIVEEGKS